MILIAILQHLNNNNNVFERNNNIFEENMNYFTFVMNFKDVNIVCVIYRKENF